MPTISLGFKFNVISESGSLPSVGQSQAFLLVDNWDDWFKYSTGYSLFVFDDMGKRHDLGMVKIGKFQMKPDERRPAVPPIFTSLNEQFFSLGQGPEYYESLRDFDPILRMAILKGLRDIAFDLILYQKAALEDITTQSLMRSVSSTTIEGQYRRILSGGAKLSKYRFAYTAPRRVGTSESTVRLTFKVEPNSSPPTNIHVIIGRNGVGKTFLLNRMVSALVSSTAQKGAHGLFSSLSDVTEFLPEERLFANVVSVTFSAFDTFFLPPSSKDDAGKTRYAYIGLRQAKPDGTASPAPKSARRLATEFAKSLDVCLSDARAERWLQALKTLDSDPGFGEANVATLRHTPRRGAKQGTYSRQESAKKLFARLSSGHKVVLLTITRLVEVVEEKTLVLIDEPEAHLHPPLLSAFVRAVSELMIHRNGVAIVATHSPVVIQEVPASCVWKLRRNGTTTTAERPDVETFGENVGSLTREVFGLEVVQSGFHRLIADAVTKQNTYEAVLLDFDSHLGGEAKAIARGLIAEKAR